MLGRNRSADGDIICPRPNWPHADPGQSLAPLDGFSPATYYRFKLAHDALRKDVASTPGYGDRSLRFLTTCSAR